ncbi:MAG: large conductance mechanosensitive channel protein MscL [Ilumatobacteraceae bacterium]
MKNFVTEFKDFINKGNLVELAVAFVLALFFVPIVNAIVDGVLLQLIAAIFGQPSFDSIGIDVGDSRLYIGTVITAIVNFLIVAFVCFLIVKAYNKMQDDEEEESGPSEVELLTEIRDSLRSR